MQNENFITGKTEEEVWQQISNQFIKNPDPLEYTAVIEQESRRVILDIDIDLGGGFESGYETTTFTSELHTSPAFRFAIHEEHFTDEIGKFFGMEDVEIGFIELDKNLVVKTNDRARVKEIFADDFVRNVFQSLHDFTFGITHHDNGHERHIPFLELQIESGITDPLKLRSIYHAFFSVLTSVEREVSL